MLIPNMVMKIKISNIFGKKKREQIMSSTLDTRVERVKEEM